MEAADNVLSRCHVKKVNILAFSLKRAKALCASQPPLEQYDSTGTFHVSFPFKSHARGKIPLEMVQN